MKKICSKIFCSTLVCGMLVGCSSSKSSEKLNVKDEVVVELGEKVLLTPATFAAEGTDSSALEDVTVSSILMESDKYDYTGFTHEVKDAGKAYLGVGEYTVTLEQNGKKYNSTLKVEDTTAPTFVSSPKSITVRAGDETFDISTRFRASDKDEVKVFLDENTDFDINTPGTYNVVIIAEDASGNQGALDVTIKVIGDGEIIDSSTFVEDETLEIPAVTDETSTDLTVDSSSSDSNTDVSAPSESEEDSSGSQDSSTSSEKPTPSACPASNAPAGAVIYRSYEEAYAAGSAWIKENPKNYFFYTMGEDDCGQTVYIVTLGTQE